MPREEGGPGGIKQWRRAGRGRGGEKGHERVRASENKGNPRARRVCCIMYEERGEQRTLIRKKRKRDGEKRGKRSDRRRRARSRRDCTESNLKNNKKKT